MLIYLKGGGMCVPFVPYADCEQHCQNHKDLCSAWTEPYFDMENNGFFGSSDPEKNPAFYNFEKGF